MPETFHRRGHHVQKAHGRRAQMAADGSHLDGAMIALMPTVADAKRLALKGGERPEDLHVTLFYLGAGSDFDDLARQMIVEHVREVLTWASPDEQILARIFGVAHWNGNGEEPSWVWSVGDEPVEGPGLRDMQLIALEALALTEMTGLPEQHTPWVPHICAAYTDDLTLTREMEKRLGTVVFDRIRVAFAGDATDIPLAGALTASGLRRAVRPHEADVDFLAIQRAWQTSTDSVTTALSGVFAKWHDSLASQVADVVDSGDMSRMRRISLDTGDASALLHAQMVRAAEESAHQVEREMRAQGLEPPRWTLVGRKTRLMQRTAEAMTDIMSGSLIITAKRRALASAGTEQTGAQVAQDLREYLAGMSDKGPREAAGAALTAAQNAGRRAVLEAAPPARYYSSEILDSNTCEPCRKLDGQEFPSLDKAYAAYPTGGYKRCKGMLRCRGMVVARWADEETEPVTAAGDAEPFHGTKGEPGYGLLHGDDKLQNRDLLNSSEESILQEDLDEAHYAGFIAHPYSFFTDPGSHDYDPEDETPEDEINYVHWEHLGRYYASGAGGSWFGDFENSRNIRRAANEAAGLDQTGHDRLLGEGDVSDHDRVAGTAMLAAVAVSPPVDRPLYRGSFYAGADPDDVEAQLRSESGLDFSVVSFTDGQGVADYFADPSLHAANGGEGDTSTRVMYEVEPGAQGILGHIFQKGMQAGTSGDDADDADYVESDEANTDFTQSHPREIVTGGHFEIGEIVREGDTIRVRLKQTKVHPPKARAS